MTLMFVLTLAALVLVVKQAPCVTASCACFRYGITEMMQLGSSLQGLLGYFGRSSRTLLSYI